MPQNTSLPTVTCVMITANRSALVRRSVRCFLQQTYPEKTLLVIDDGQEDLAPVLSAVPPDRLRYIRLQKKEGQNLGFLRNLGLAESEGDFVAQWDDDDWYHPLRLQKQMEPLLAGADAVCLSATLMHLNTAEFMQHPYVGHLKDGVPGTIVHRNDPAARYPLEARGEDTTFLDYWKARRYVKLPMDQSHLFIRCFHGSNTWEQVHFTRRIRNNVLDTLGYVWHKHVLRNVYGHRRFRLSGPQREAFSLYMNESAELGLV